MSEQFYNTRCSICPNTHRCVGGDGPSNARVMAIGEEPGHTEDAGGRAFIGAAGREFNLNYLALAGLRRSLYDAEDSDVYVTNARKCRMGQNKTPTYGEMIGCANHFIPYELGQINPAVVVLMGSVPCKLLGERGVDLEAEHGTPRWGNLYGWEGWVVPMYHPAAGLHDGNMMTPLIEDWERLGPWLRDGTWVWAEDNVASRDYRLCKTADEIEDYFITHSDIGEFLHHDGTPPLLGVDTETHAGQRWSIQISSKVGTGLMIQTDTGEFDHWLLKRLRYWVEKYEWALHNAEADLWVADLLGLHNQPYRDTMAEAYLFQNLPQKLKALSRRVLGRTRMSWDELVTPYSKEKLHEWMTDGILYAADYWRITTERRHKRTGRLLKPEVKLSRTESLLFEIDQYMVNNPDYPVWDKIAERVPVTGLEKLVAKFGPLPQKGIGHVPLDQAVWYGVSDADDTLAVATRFDEMRREFKVGLSVVEEDRDIGCALIRSRDENQARIS